MLLVCVQAGGGRGVADVARLDVPGPAGLGGQQPDHAAVAEGDQRVDQRVDQVAVVVAPPQQHGVDDVVVVLVDQARCR